MFSLVYPFFIPFYPVLLCFSLFVSPPPTNLKIGNRWGLNFGIAASSWVENSQILWWWRNLFCKTLSWKLFICYARVHIMCSTLYNEGQISSVKSLLPPKKMLTSASKGWHHKQSKEEIVEAGSVLKNSPNNHRFLNPNKRSFTVNHHSNSLSPKIK